MPDHRWHFRSQRKGDRDRNPIQNEFFASEQVGSLVSALIREGTQNSGDARSGTLDQAEPVRIRIYVSGDEAALSAERAARWGEGLWDHVSAADSGLRHPPTPDDPCRFIVFEDFGTTGLTGDTASDDASKEPFYCFFRAENTSSKDADTGGSWGVGKTAFPRASAANAFFAMSRREDDDRTVLMGSLTLRTRKVDGVKYTPDSWFGEPEECEDEGGTIQPIEDAAVTQAFASDFHITRADEAGTSIVVPWCHESLTRRAVAEAVIESNFIPIITGAIEVKIASGSGADDLTLNAETIEDVLNRLELENMDDLLAGVRLAQWARTEGQVERVAAVHNQTSPSVKWEQYSLAEGDQEKLRNRFDAGRPIAIRVPVPMSRFDRDTPRTSHLDVFVQHMESGSTVRPVFVRGSVVVPDHKIKRVTGAVAIIRASDDELGNLLRSAEDPGHKEWSTETNNFAEVKETFKYAKSYLALARQAAFRAARLLQDVEAEEDFDLLSDVFSLPKETEDPNRPGGGGGKKRKKKKKPVVTVERAPQIISVTRAAGGFTVTPASADAPTPAKIRIRAAYDVRSKNPFKQWDIEDFEFGKNPVLIEAQKGVKITLIEGNRLVADVSDKDFRISVKGFDTERGDLIIDARPEGRIDD